MSYMSNCNTYGLVMALFKSLIQRVNNHKDPLLSKYHTIQLLLCIIILKHQSTTLIMFLDQNF